MRGIKFFFMAMLLVLSTSALAQKHTFGVQKDHFSLDGKPFQIISGEMHYARIPREYWHDRLKKARAMGLNTVTTYVFWNLHEPRPGIYDFAGQKDVAAFIRAAQEEGLFVILRPGPYVCAEWDLGGLPAWLLADRTIELRSRDEKFMKAAETWLRRLGQELAPLQVAHGGPIIAVQVENEYGSFDNDKVYMERIHKALVDAGLGEVMMYTADGPSQLPDGTLPELPAVVNFGPGYAPKAFAALEKFRPGQPKMAGEYWAGWFDHWGVKHHVTDAAQQEKELDWMLSAGYSVNFYMFHGGTTFGFMNGANYDDGYKPQTSSYDYDAALDESGRPTPKYFAFREIISKYASLKPPAVPETKSLISFAPVSLNVAAGLFGNLSKPIHSEHPKTMEEVGQSYGYILYRTRVPANASGDLVINDLQDYAVVFVNGKKVGTLDRRLKQNSLDLGQVAGGATVDVLVENSGRINFTKRLRTERKGIGGMVTLGGHELVGWEIYPLPMTDLAKLRFQSGNTSGPAFYRAEFNITEPGDTFLDTRALSKGVAWVNGHLLGRFWKIGPQQTLYVPGPWLRKGRNEVIVFDLDGASGKQLQGLNKPVLDELHLPE